MAKANDIRPHFIPDLKVGVINKTDSDSALNLLADLEIIAYKILIFALLKSLDV